MAESGTMNVRSSPMRVRLVAYTRDPMGICVGSARSCYSTRLVLPGEVSPSQRSRISRDIFQAGHHTPFQHPTFVFAIENVSRHLVWSLLHAHPFYNSEQGSQRYNVLRSPDVHIPEFKEGRSGRVFRDAVRTAWEAYAGLIEVLHPLALERMRELARLKKMGEMEMGREARRRAAENARYVLPISAHTHLYHTVNATTLSRYVRWARECDASSEALRLIEMMRGALREVDPEFAEVVMRPLANRPADAPGVGTYPQGDGDAFARGFDEQMDGMRSRLISWSPGDESELLAPLREVFGVPEGTPIDLDGCIRRMMHYEYPLFTLLNHFRYTFRKCMSHAADSQAQRHRYISASRPLLSRVHTTSPDAVVPGEISSTPEARKIFEDTMRTLWEVKNDLISRGERAEDAVYILPNAVKLRYTESATFLAFRTKWRLRTCFLAQREIYDASMEEVDQVAEVHPMLAGYVGPPCLDERRRGAPGGPCPEGTRWCGVRVWLNFPGVKRVF